MTDSTASSPLPTSESHGRRHGITRALTAAVIAVAALMPGFAQGATATPSTLPFGGQSMGTTSPALAVTFTNDAGASITVSSVTVNNAQFAPTHNCGTLAAGASCTVNVTFSPTPAAGALLSTTSVSGNLTITSNGSGSPHIVSLTGTGEKSLVTHYYRSILRRAPDASGKAFWEGEATRLTSLAANVNETWFAMATFFYFSPEYTALNRNNTEFVTDLYNTFFNRGPDAGGLSFWIGQITAGVPREIVLVSFMFSPEFQIFTQGIFGNTAARKEIDTVVDFYRGALSRLPDTSGYNFWVQQFRTAQCSGASAVNTQVESISSNFFNGSEYAGRARTNAQFVGDIYNAFLRRGGDQAGVLFWIGQLNGGATRNSIRQQFIASTEFQSRVTAVIAEGCFQLGQLRVSVGGFGHVSSAPTGLSCGSVPASVAGSSAKCVINAVGNVTLTATPFSSNFQFSGWAGDTTCTNENPCTVSMSQARWVRAKFTPVVPNSNVCSHLGLVGDKVNRPLNNNYPNLAVGGSFTDPNFGTTIRRLTNVTGDGRGANLALKPVYSTISAWNADESYLILYRTSGSASGGHELFNGKTYAFIRKLNDLPWNDLEQVYWDATQPNIIYGGENNVLYRYDVDAPAGQRLTALRNFASTCGSGRQIDGGADPFFNSWDSKIFGLSCVDGGVMFSFNAATNTLGTLAPASTPRASPSDGVQALPSGTKLFLSQPQPGGNRAARVFSLNMVAGAFLDQESGDEHAGTNRLFNGDDTYNAIQFDTRNGGSTGNGNLVQWNMNSTPDAATGRILGRVIVGPSTGYPYPITGTHVGGTSFHRTGLVTVTMKGDYTGATLLDNEILFVDSDASTNGGNFACRVGHNRTKSEDYWAEPHGAISPSGTRIIFGSSWGSTADPATVNTYVVELPGYKP